MILLTNLQSKISEMLDDELDYFLDMTKEELKEIISYYYKLGGKRLRPTLFVALANAFECREDINPYSLVIELIHTMSLYHDDVIDDAYERRGAPTVHIKWDVPTAIVGGDVLHSLVHGHLLNALKQERLKNKDFVIRFLSDLTHFVELEIGNAVLLEMKYAKTNTIPTLDESMKMTASKTAPLFAFSASAAAYLSEKTINTVDAMYQMGWNLGFAFQLLDDIGDYFESDKDIGGDLREDKKTPILVMINEKYPAELRHYREIDTLTTADIEKFKIQFKDIFLEIISIIKRKLQKASEGLEFIPSNEGKDQVQAIFKLMELKNNKFLELLK